MTGVPLGQSAYNRAYGQEPEIQLLNRFIEKNITNQVEHVALLARPGNTLFKNMGAGRERVLAHQPGVFSDDLFVVSGSALFRYDGVNPPTAILGSIAGSGKPSITLVAGPSYDHMFIADGNSLQYYDGISAATGTLSVSSGGITAGDVVKLDTTYYSWTAGSVDAGTPTGTSGSPWLVAVGVDTSASLISFEQAISAHGTPGVDYSTALVANPTVDCVSSDATSASVVAKARGTGGNSISVTTTGANLSWGASTLLGGGVEKLNTVATPDNVGILSLETLAGFVVCSVAGSQRFYWIQPGGLTIDALDFASAESEPDQIIEIIRVADVLYFIGQASIEVWYATGSVGAPFLRQQGLAFSQGMLPGSATTITTQIFAVLNDGVAYTLVGGLRRISNSGIEERIRISRLSETFKAWSFTLDGHSFYILSLGAEGTFAYDETTGSWSKWQTSGQAGWSMENGVTWKGDIIAADVSSPVIWRLDPTSFVDDDTKPQTRVVTGEVPIRGREFSSNTFFQISASVGSPDVPLTNPVTSPTVQLRFSDDQGKTFFDAGEITITPGDFEQTIVWRSLGTAKQPGRIFEITDTGAVVRIDGADADFVD